MKYTKSSNGFLAWLNEVKTSPYFTLAIAFVAILGFFGIKSEYFFTPSNLLSIGMYAAVVGICGCSMTFMLAAGLIDLSSGAIMGLSGMAGAVMAAQTNNAALAIFTTLATGLICGVINGLLITKCKIIPFIATVGTAKLFRGLVYVICSGKSVPVNLDSIKVIGRGYIGGIPVAFLIYIACVVIFCIIAKYTVFGRKVFIIGGNASASYLSGINVDRMRFYIMGLNGLMCGLSGLLIIAQLGSCLQESGEGNEFNAISGAILGGVSMSGGKGYIIGTTIGVLLLASLKNGLTQINIPTYWQDVFTGLVLIIAVAVDVARTEASKRALLKSR